MTALEQPASAERLPSYDASITEPINRILHFVLYGKDSLAKAGLTQQETWELMGRCMSVDPAYNPSVVDHYKGILAASDLESAGQDTTEPNPAEAYLFTVCDV